MRQRAALGLMIVALGILVIPGIVINNLQNNGMISVATTQTCSSNPSQPTCVLNTAVGCQANPSYCQLSGSSISFLNNCSPFTGILTLNFVAFVTSFFNSCSGGSFTQNTQSQQTNFPQTGNVTLPGLKATYGFHTLNAQVQWKSSLVTHPIVQGITTPYFLTCLSFRGVLSTGQTTYSCNWVDSASPTPNGETMSCWLFGNATDVNNAICNNWAYSQAGGGTSQLVTNLLQGNILGFFMSLIGGILILLLALGINVGAATVNVGANPQGTKLSQVFGIALLIWGALYSEFSTWFTSGFLPYGLDGAIGIVGIGLVACFFFGTYELSQTGTGTGTMS